MRSKIKYEKYNVSYDRLDEKNLIIPRILKETFKVGVQAEIDNIAMYEKFFKDEKLPVDVREIFIRLRDGLVESDSARSRTPIWRVSSEAGRHTQPRSVGRGRQRAARGPPGCAPRTEGDAVPPAAVTAPSTAAAIRLVP